MTDTEIIKALGYCGNTECNDECPLFCKYGCQKYLMTKTIDLIKRQQAEIERLHNILLSFTDEVHTWSNKKGYDTTELSLIPILNKAESVRKAIIAEAVKEFAEKLKEKLWSPTETWLTDDIVTETQIDEVLKEMEGE